ncbi:zinc knuckle-domain-containing protein [Xylaria nigripes]|nr:zinc knuckle-domain-containing protein [Xylaria nigripes]
MYRRGPSKSTPVNVQCQKCLKRGHYSYECKASAQERPYVARPSRTQQLLNPKLAPKLASDTTLAPRDTKGIADQELAKREAERARQRQLEDDDDTDNDIPERRRSNSYDSVSTISTRDASTSNQRVSMSPQRPSRAVQSPLPVRGSSRERSSDSGGDYERRYSPSPKDHKRDTKTYEAIRRRTRSLGRDDSPPSGRFDAEERPINRRPMDRRRRGDSRSPSRSPQREDRNRYRSRSPQGAWRQNQGSQRYNNKLSGERRRNDREQRGGPPRRDRRERSLSPFSKRLALTQAMNADL